MITSTTKQFNQQRSVICWEGLGANTDGDPVSVLKGEIKSVQFKGSFHGARVTLYGTNDPSENQRFLPLTEWAGGTISVSTEAIETISQQCVSIKPSVKGGDANTDISVYVYVVG